MYKITTQYKLPHLKDIDIEFFFEKNKVTNNYIDNHNIFLKLPDVKKINKKIKNEDDAISSSEFICLRPSIKLSAYYRLASLFIKKGDETECKKLLRNDFIKNSYGDVRLNEYKRISKIYDDLKKEGYNYKVIRNIITDSIIDFSSYYQYNHNTFLTLIKKYYSELTNITFEEGKNILLNNYDEFFKELNPQIAENILNNKKEELRKIEEEKINREKDRLVNIEKERLRKQKEKENINNLIKYVNDQKSINDYIKENYNLSSFNDDSKKILMEQASKLLRMCITNLKKKNTDNINKNYSLYKEISNILLPISYLDIVNYLHYEHNIKVKYPHSEIINNKNMRTKNNKKEYELYLLGTIKNIDFVKKLFNNSYNLSNNYNLDYLKNLRIFIFKNFNNYTISKQDIEYLFNKDIDNIINSFDGNLFNKLIDDLINENIMSHIENKNILDKKELFNIIKEKFYLKQKEKLKISFNKTRNLKEINKDNITHYLSKQVFKHLFIDRGLQQDLDNIVLQQSKLFQSYKDMFFNTRRRNRKITFYCGETNSGKTYSAFEELKKYNTGVYLAPLRLLAIEGQEEIEKRGHSCNLLTGEERVFKDNANFTSSTVEMLDTNKEYDVAIIDEVQMVADMSRGKSWFKAIVGVNAKHLILVGSKDIKEEIIKIANYLEEDLEIKEFDKKVKLSTLSKPISVKKKLKSNTAVIAFSKKNLMALKEHYESLGNTVSIIYGKLPPEIKHKESEKFRTGESEVLVSTDAIGMGLNLPIETIIFSEIEKFDGFYIDYLDPALIKQISGRAGRFNLFEEGYVTAFNRNNLSYIKESLKDNTEINVYNRYVPISIEIFKEIKNIFNTDNINDIVKLFQDLRFDFSIKSSEYDYISNVALYLNNNKNLFSDSENVKLLNAPINGDRNDRYLNVFKYLIKTLAQARKKSVIYEEKDFYKFYNYIKKSFDFADNSEQYYKVIDMINFFTLNFLEFSNFEDKIKKEKDILIEDIEINLKSNFVEDEIKIYEKEWLYY